MAEPCRSDCPNGDCAGCAFPRALTACRPVGACAQRLQCSRYLAQRVQDEIVIDGTVLRHSAGDWCPMFVDARGALLEAA